MSKQDIKNKDELIYGKIKLNADDLINILPSHLNLENENDIKTLLKGDFNEYSNWSEIDKNLCFYINELFNYTYYTLNWSMNEFFRHIHNSLEFHDYLFYLYKKIKPYSNKEETEEKWNPAMKEKTYNSILIKYPLNLEKKANENQFLKFVEYSKVDDNPIYQLNIDIPNNFKLILPINNYL